jgi:hypothetical protein
MIRQILPTLIALVIGIAFGRWFFGSGATPLPPLQPPATAAYSASRTAPPGDGDGMSSSAAAGKSGDLALQLQREAEARVALEERLAVMEQQLGQLEEQVGEFNARLDPEALANAALLQSIEELEPAQPMDERQRALQRFVEAGFTPARAEELKAEQDRLALERLFLRDQARREGWLGTERYRDEMQRVEASFERLRSDLGDDDFDRYLYATGRPNRVVVRDTLTGGPGAQAGLRPGDSIISYDGERVFNTRTLVNETQGGSFGSPTPIEIERDGERMVLYLPRGPLGINMRSAVRKPSG